MDEHGNPLPPGAPPVAPPVAPPPVTMTAEHLGALLDKIQEQNTLQANQHQLAMDALLKVQRDADKKREEWETEREARRAVKEKEREETRKKEKAEEQSPPSLGWWTFLGLTRGWWTRLLGGDGGLFSLRFRFPEILMLLPPPLVANGCPGLVSRTRAEMLSTDASVG